MNRMSQRWRVMRRRVAEWLREGVSPRRLALTLAIGFVLGCLPLMGIPTGLCAMVAIAFRLNMPAMQAANYAAMPFQFALVVPLMRLGAKLTPMLSRPGLDLKTRTLICVISDTVMGRPEELKIHLRMARRQGWTEDELVEAILHLSGYCGLPLVREALLAARETFAELRAET